MKYESHLKTAEALTMLLENRFKILGFKFGLEPVLGLIPIIGDVIGFVLSAYIVWIGIKLHVPQDKIAIMYKNIVMDLVIGIIPVIGSVGDFLYRANSKNLDIIKKYQREYEEGEVITYNAQLNNA